MVSINFTHSLRSLTLSLRSVAQDGSTQAETVAFLDQIRAWKDGYGGDRVVVKDCELKEGETGSCGVSRARNDGLRHAVDTPYVLFLDDDDLMEVRAFPLFRERDTSESAIASWVTGRA